MLSKNVEAESVEKQRTNREGERPLKHLVLTVVAMATFAILGNPVQAAPVTYTLSSTATGTLGGSLFTDALVTVTLTGDTSTVIPFSPVLFNPGTATVNVAGLGTATLTDSIGILSTFDDLTLFGTSAVVILDLSNPSDPSSGTGILGQIGPEFFGYNLQTPFGPDTGAGGPFSGSQMTPHFPTTVGDLTWAVGQPLGTSTFTAVVPTPEPGTLALIGVGLLALVGGHFWRRRLTRTTSRGN